MADIIQDIDNLDFPAGSPDISDFQDVLSLQADSMRHSVAIRLSLARLGSPVVLQPPPAVGRLLVEGSVPLFFDVQSGVGEVFLPAGVRGLSVGIGPGPTQGPISPGITGLRAPALATVATGGEGRGSTLTAFPLPLPVALQVPPLADEFYVYQTAAPASVSMFTSEGLFMGTITVVGGQTYPCAGAGFLVIASNISAVHFEIAL